MYQIPNPIEDDNSMLEGMDKILEKAVSDSKPPYRIVVRFVPSLHTKETIAIQAYFEQRFHVAMFENFNGSVICSYEFSVGN